MPQGSHGNYTDEIWPCNCGSNVGVWVLPRGLPGPTRDRTLNTCQDCGQPVLASLPRLALPIPFFAFLANFCLVWKRKELVTGDRREDPFPQSLLLGRMSLTLSASTFPSAKWAKGFCCFLCRANGTFIHPRAQEEGCLWSMWGPLRPAPCHLRKVS